MRPVPLIDPSRCDGCGLCLRACPTGALALHGNKAIVACPEACDYSGLCEMICPRQAILRPFEVVIRDRSTLVNFSCNLSEILTMFVATVAGLPLPLLPLQILWLNLVTDVFPALALAGEQAEEGIMRRPPLETRRRRPPASFISSVVVQAALLAGATLAAFVWVLRSSGDVRQATTVAFLALGLGQLFHVFNSRFETGSAFSRRTFSNRAVWAAIAFTIGLQVAAVYLPVPQSLLKTVAPTPTEWSVVLAAALVPPVTIELYKAITERWKADKSQRQSRQ